MSAANVVKAALDAAKTAVLSGGPPVSEHHLTSAISELLKPRVLTPFVFLRVQASRLAEETPGMLIGEVTTTTTNQSEMICDLDAVGKRNTIAVEKFEVRHNLNVIAPALNNYRHRFVVVYHKADMVYPARVETMDGTFGAATEEEFQELLRKTLLSPLCSR